MARDAAGCTMALFLVIVVHLCLASSLMGCGGGGRCASVVASHPVCEALLHSPLYSVRGMRSAEPTHPSSIILPPPPPLQLTW
jgi:hypothetical protein